MHGSLALNGTITSTPVCAVCLPACLSVCLLAPACWQMASTIGSVQASGLLVRARQVCATPQTRPMRMAVGRWHAADVPMVVKGTRPPMKVSSEGAPL